MTQRKKYYIFLIKTLIINVFYNCNDSSTKGGRSDLYIEFNTSAKLAPVFLYCPIDSVIGDKSGFPITKDFLDMMHM
ncbi:hypothetical protein [Clostridium cadaveris]|uniref:hypothetical protein n=1 Tax=Clostridium cadaveris TaxID=1529 RepID=UPI0039952613